MTTELDVILAKAPVPFVVVNTHDVIISSNDAALRIGLQPDTAMACYIRGLEASFVDHVRQHAASHIYHLHSESGMKRCRATVNESGDYLNVWFLDVSEQLVMAEQVRRLKQPDARKMRQINQLAITAIGYSELLQVILSDQGALQQGSLSLEKLAMVRHYQDEITQNLNAIASVVADERASGARGQVLVADQHGALMELISELLRSEGYKVAGFSDASSALTYFQLYSHSVQKAIIDESLSGENQLSLAAALRAAAPTLPLLLLTEDPDKVGDGYITKPLDFQVLLTAMEDGKSG